MNIKPDELVPTAKKKFYFPTYEEAWQIRSGYGVNVEISPHYSSSGNCTSNDYTTTPNGIITFPEFNYGRYNRVMDRDNFNPMKLKENEWSHYEHRVHFSPVWYPDGIYRVKAEFMSVSYNFV